MKNFVFISTFFALSFAHAIQFDLMHTLPECPETAAKNKKAITYCSSTDSRRLAEKAGMEKRVLEILAEAKNPAKAEIFIAYFSFSNSTVKNKLCDMGKEGFKITGYFDSSNIITDKKLPPSYPELLEKCQGPSGDNVKVHFLGAKDTSVKPIVWRLHHNKFLIVDSGEDNKAHINFSSGNLSAFGLSAHFDHWVVTQAEKDSNFYAQHMCVVDALAAAVEDGKGDNPKKYRATLDACLADTLWTQDAKWVEKAIEQEKIAPLFAPNPQDQVLQVLLNQIDSVVAGGKIYGAMQHFLHAKIAMSLKRAVDRGVKVNLLMDDDIVSGESNVPGVREFYNRLLKPNGIAIRFMQTNATDHQMMHNKFLILEGVKKLGKNRVFSGAGHFTTAGMKNNYENFYVTEVDSLTEKYKELYEYMLKNSLTERQASPQPEAAVVPAAVEDEVISKPQHIEVLAEVKAPVEKKAEAPKKQSFFEWLFSKLSEGKNVDLAEQSNGG